MPIAMRPPGKANNLNRGFQDFRYCDDFVLLSTDPAQLREWLLRIAVYLRVCCGWN
jgi:hypothetical protein